MTIDERVRDALHAYADPIEPGPGSWDRIEARLDERLPRERRARGPLVVAGIGILVIVALIAAAVVRDLDDRSNVATDTQIGDPGSRIAAVVDGNRIVVNDGAGGAIEREIFRHSGIVDVSSSVDGQAVYVTTDDPGPCRGGPQTFRVPLDGGPAKDLGLTGVTSMREGRSPDGQPVIAYTGAIDCSDAGRMIEYGADDGTVTPPEVQFPADTTDVRILDWSADGSTLLVRTEASAGARLQRVEVVTGRVMPLQNAAGDVASFLNDPPNEFMYIVNERARGASVDLATIDGQIVSVGPVIDDPVRSIDVGPGVGQDGLGVTADGHLFIWAGLGVDFPAVAYPVTAAAWVGEQARPDPPEPTATPPQRVLVFGTTARGAGSMEILPSANGGGVGDMGSADGIRAGTPVAVSDGFAYVVRKSVNSTCGDGDSIFRQPIGPGARSGDEISNATAPAISPDGKYLAYLRCTGGSDNATIMLRDLEDGSERETSGLFTTRLLEFAPDSRHVLVEGRADASGPLQARELDLVGGETEPGRAIPAGVTVTSYWGDASLLAINARSSPPSVVTVAPTSGEVRERLFDVSDVPGVITDVVPNRTGTAMLVMVEDGRLFWWAPGMSAPVKLDENMLTAAWMPDARPQAASEPSAGAKWDLEVSTHGAGSGVGQVESAGSTEGG